VIGYSPLTIDTVAIVRGCEQKSEVVRTFLLVTYVDSRQAQDAR